MSYSFLPLFAYQREKELARVFLCHRCQKVSLLIYRRAAFGLRVGSVELKFSSLLYVQNVESHVIQVHVKRAAMWSL